MASKKALAIIAGVGPGTGTAIAKKFATLYDVVLLARSETSYETALKEVKSSGGSAVGISADVSDENSVKSAFESLKEKFPNTPVAAAVFNVGGSFVRGGFLETKLADFQGSLQTNAIGAFNFAHASVPLLLAAAKDKSLEHPPTLIFTGATASVRGGALFSGFAPAKWAVRALSQSLAREFGPQGVHVAHAIIDGAIDIEKTKAWDIPKISPEAIADTYLTLHSQHRSAWTWELDLRPDAEKW